MQLPQFVSEQFDSTIVNSLPGFALSLGLAALLGILLGQAYIRFGGTLSNRKIFARNFLLLTVTTTLIIYIVKSSLALSLGLVGALSIVRFRAAIKEPEELVFLFLAMSVGLGLGAGHALITVVAFVVVLGIVAVRSLARTSPEQPNLYLTVSSSAPGKLRASQVLDSLAASGATASLKRYDETSDGMEASFLVTVLDGPDVPEGLGRALRDLRPSLLNRYQRRYFLSADGRFRLTVDSDLRFLRIRDGAAAAAPAACPCAPAVIVEMKFALAHAESAPEIAALLPFPAVRCSKCVLGIEG